MTTKLPGVVDNLEKNIRRGFDFHTEDVLDFAGPCGFLESVTGPPGSP